MTDDGAFRVVVASTSHTVRSAIHAQRADGAPARLLGELLTGSILFRETMAPSLRVQAILLDAKGKGRLVADSFPDGGTRGLVSGLQQPREFELGAGATLELMRTLPNGSLNRGVVGAPERGGLSRALMTYMQTSEQVLSAIAVSCALGPDRRPRAGGYVVQLLPELPHDALTTMTERLSTLADPAELLRQASDIRRFLELLLADMPFTLLDSRPVRFQCHCSHVRVIASLAILPRSEIEAMITEGDVVQAACDYCGKEYRVSPQQLLGLLQQS
ncbi:MAG: Hsp33 family molecular chaperone HslO [Proteobacteria bacterium]|nr:Hsp33 family molecular chaperone HslO [Pseudomonadota bacterium]